MPHSIKIFCLQLCKIFHVFLFQHISLFDNITYNCIHSFFMGYAKKIETQQRCFRIICRKTFRQNIAVGQNVVGFGSPLNNPFKYVARLDKNVYQTNSTQKRTKRASKSKPSFLIQYYFLYSTKRRRFSTQNMITTISNPLRLLRLS